MKVLIITYYFPPAGGAGVQRTLKFVRYLADFGWQPVVLTAAEADYPASDPTLLAEVPPQVPVYRAPIFEPYRLYRRFTGRPPGEATDMAVLTLDERRRRRWSERISEFIRAAFFIPDARIGWYRGAVRMGREIVAREGIDVLFSSAPPYTAHLIGARLQRLCRCPWVADFRDSWIGWLSAPQWRPWPSRAVERRMEAQVLRRADRLLHVTDGVRQDLLSRHPQYEDHRWRWLPNGYDAADFAQAVPMAASERFVLTYTGSMYGHRHPGGLLRALEEMLKSDPGLAGRFRVRLVGRVGEAIRSRIAASPAAALFEEIPYVTHAGSLGYLMAGDACLLIIDDAPANRGIVTGKLFEYIGSQRPILALAPEGEAADLIRRHGLGEALRSEDIAGIRAALERMMAAGRRRLATDEAVLRTFERRRQTQQLAQILDEVVGGRG